MSITIKEKITGDVIMVLTIPFFQSPKEAVYNICRNMGYLPADVEWDTK